MSAASSSSPSAKKAQRSRRAAPRSTPAKKRPARRARAAAPPAPPAPRSGLQRPQTAKQIVAWLQRHGNKATRAGMVRYAIPAERAFGIAVGTLQTQAKLLGQNHRLAAALWKTGWYEARMLAAFIDDPAQVTPAQMDRWCRDFDSWAICDTVCFHLFDRSPHALRKAEQWSRAKGEQQRRAAFALLASVALHARATPDSALTPGLGLVERAATDPRTFVKKAVLWALRAIGSRSRKLHHAALTLAQRLVGSTDATARWIGKEALETLTSPATLRRLAAPHRR